MVVILVRPSHPEGSQNKKKIKKKGGDRGATQDLLSRVELHVGIVIPKLC